jgi:pimeloyl-ACP methyl ester carboxylesterase/SAM-dependent methyltransferase
MRASAALFLFCIPGTASAQVACGSATVDARSIRYCSGGSGDVTVVFESGIRGTTATWDSAAARLSPFARVITYDRAGHGGSAPSMGSRTPGDVSTDLHRLLDQIGEREPVVLVCHAEGCWFVRDFALRFPSRVRALVLIDPPHEEFPSRAARILSPEELARRDSTLAAATPDDAGRAEREGIRATPSGRWAASLPDVPLWVLIASRHDFEPASRAAELEGLWSELTTDLVGRSSQGRVQPVDGAGPDLPLTNPEAVLQAVRGVISRSEPRPADTKPTDWIQVVMMVLGIPAVIVALLQIPKLIPTRAEKPPHRTRLPKSPPAGRAVRVIEQANAYAAQVYQSHMHGARASAEAETMWAKTWPDDDWKVQRAWVEPSDLGTGQADSVVDEVLAMLRADEHRIWITAPAGSGKSTFMNRLFFEAIDVTGRRATMATPGLRPLPAPMFVQPRNVGAQGIQQLREAKDPFPVFLEGWLANRAIEVPAESRDALFADFERAIQAGDIALFIDGFDELVDLGLGPFLRDLLARASCWVCAERSDRRMSRSGFSVPLPAVWRIDKVRDHLKVRWPDRPSWASRVYEHLRKETDDDHILRVPRYLDLFLQRLEEADRLPEEAELRQLTRGGPELAADIVALALERLPAAPDVREHELNARLFRVAAARVLQADFVLPVRDRDPTWERILQMTEFVSHVVTNDGDNIRITHPALVDYFLAGHIASELRTSATTITQGDRHWSRGLLAGVSAWLRRSADPAITRQIWHRIDSAKDGDPLTNLLELVVQLDMDGKQNARRDVPESDRRRAVTISDRDLTRRNIESAELRLVTFVRCRFTGADLSEADLQHVTFHDCDLTGANLKGANALGAEFARCRFLDPANPALLPRVEGLQIEAAEFHEGTEAASDVDAAWLTTNGATRTRTRYGAEFGRIFFNRQAAFLGPEAEKLERGAYRERIEAALGHCDPARAITVVDLMAGGGNEWLAGLVAPAENGAPRFPGLQVLGIDRDEPQLRELKRKFPEVFKWHRLEIGTDGIDLPAMAGEAFVGPSQRLEADLIVAKKAIHELRRPLQPKIIEQCFAGLRPGGELVLFADSPGPLEPAPHAMSEAEFNRIDREIRELLLDPDVLLATVRDTVVRGIAFGGSHADQIRFCNLWVMVKDWANDNLHEVRNRWFSSAAEIRWWAKAAGFHEVVAPAAARYRIAVARFNERGIQRVVHHLERNGPSVIATDGSMLSDWLSAHGDERQALLLEFTAHHLAPGGELERALNAKPVSIDWGLIHEDLRKLSGGGRETISFEFPVHVLSFRKAAEGRTGG